MFRRGGGEFASRHLSSSITASFVDISTLERGRLSARPAFSLFRSIPTRAEVDVSRRLTKGSPDCGGGAPGASTAMTIVGDNLLVAFTRKGNLDRCGARLRAWPGRSTPSGRKRATPTLSPACPTSRIQDRSSSSAPRWPPAGPGSPGSCRAEPLRRRVGSRARRSATGRAGPTRPRQAGEGSSARSSRGSSPRTGRAPRRMPAGRSNRIPPRATRRSAPTPRRSPGSSWGRTGRQRSSPRSSGPRTRMRSRLRSQKPLRAWRPGTREPTRPVARRCSLRSRPGRRISRTSRSRTRSSCSRRSPSAAGWRRGSRRRLLPS